MDKISTPITEQLLVKVLKDEHYPEPSVASLEFIRNFARNFKVEKNLNAGVGELVLN